MNQFPNIDVNKIKNCDIMLVHGVSFLASIIEDFQEAESEQGGKYTHAAIFMWMDDVLYVFESDKYGIRRTKFDEYLKAKKDILCLCPKRVFPSKITEQEILDFMLDACGTTKYDKFGLLKRAWKYTKLWINKILRTKIFKDSDVKPNTDKFMCGVWVAYCYNKFYNVFPEWQNMDPVEFYNSDLFIKNKVPVESI